ncbi:MAG: hypothetical protein ACFB50_19330 [Rubrobacteraceae bacterium]
MKRLLKWLLPVLIVAEVTLVRLDLLDLRDAMFILIVVEILLLIVGGKQVLRAVREYRRNRDSGFDGWRALEGGLTILLPQLAARLIVSELRTFYCLFKWALRRTRLRKEEFSYHKRSTLDMLVLMIVLVTPVEVLVIELLLQAFLPLIWLRVLVVFLEICFLFWIVGFYASRVVLPHRLGATGLRLHHGIFAEGFIPYTEIQSTKQVRRKAPEWGDGLRTTEDGAYLAIGGSTNVKLELGTSHVLRGFFRATVPVDTVYLAVDEPKVFVQTLGCKLRNPSVDDPGRRRPFPEVFPGGCAYPENTVVDCRGACSSR